MASLRDFVRRFRPAGTPGSAAPTGVPPDRESEATAELAPVFAALEDTVAQAAAIVEAANREAERRRAEARRDADRVVAEARQRAEAMRAATAATAVESAEREREELLDRARRDARAIADRAAERLPELVDRIVARVRDIGRVEEGAR